MTTEGQLLWKPGPDWIAQANVTAFTRWLSREYQRTFPDYDSLWAWSVEHLEDFWEAVWKYMEIESSAPYERVLGSKSMPGAGWFPGARLNYAQHILR
ncbi:MAG: acetyl-coenzyme A synthetase N-terminal domain-containing protein, partial [Gammaproteobacteria bacterium]